jgi:GDP-4-dehydro-6-deoxy-D-mannose reductase
MTRPTLVTGAAGFAGSHLLDLLRESDGEIVGWHRPGHQPPNVAAEWEAVDVMDRAAVIEAVARLRPAVVYHCAGAAHVGRAWEGATGALATNVMATHHVLEGLRLAGQESRVLVPSSALVYRPADVPLGEHHPLVPTSPYGLSKLAQELLACHAGSGRIHVTVARAFNHFGPRQDPAFAASGFARQIARIEAGFQAPEIVVGNLEARRDLTDVRDTVRAYQLIVERGRPGRAYNVCSGRALPIGDLLNMLVGRSHVSIEVRVDPSLFRPNDVPLLVGDPTRLHDEVGWTPEMPFEQTLEDTLNYWRSQVH